MKMLDAMSVEELNDLLMPYMDRRVNPHAIAVEVRLSETPGKGGRYEVLLIMQDGSEKVVKFRDRHSRLVYIYTLLHPQGYLRRSLTKDNYRALRELFSKIYFASAEPLLKAIGSDYSSTLKRNIPPEAIFTYGLVVRRMSAGSTNYVSS